MFSIREYTNVSSISEGKMNKMVTRELCADYTNPRSNVTEAVTCVWIPFDPKKQSSVVGKQDIQIFMESFVDSAKSQHLILITDSISTQAVQYLHASSVYCEILSYDDTAFPKDDHVLVPHYTILSEDDITRLEKQFGARTTFNKMIVKKDAQARYRDFREGDVVQSKQKSIIGGFNIAYRLLITEDDVG